MRLITGYRRHVGLTCHQIFAFQEANIWAWITREATEDQQWTSCYSTATPPSYLRNSSTYNETHQIHSKERNSSEAISGAWKAGLVSGSRMLWERNNRVGGELSLGSRITKFFSLVSRGSPIIPTNLKQAGRVCAVVSEGDWSLEYTLSRGQ